MSPACRITRGLLGHNEGVRLENDRVAVTVLVGKGADIFELRWLPADVDVMWKPAWGTRDPARPLHTASSVVAWLDTYSGGWQVLFPSGGGPATYKGAELVFHGEASLDPWTLVTAEADDTSARIRVALRLVRSPFTIERTVTLPAGSPTLRIEETIVNHAGEPMDYMWGHHPAFGAPFLSGACRIETGARSIVADEAYAGPANPLVPGSRHAWPMADGPLGPVDLSAVPAEGTPRSMLGYLGDFTEGWYAITNPELGFGVGLAWPREALPYAWMWQEMRASTGYPWYGNTYTLAIEPNTSIPGQGLEKVIAAGTQGTLEPGGRASLALVATFFPAGGPIARIDPDGTVHRR